MNKRQRNKKLKKLDEQFLDALVDGALSGDYSRVHENKWKTFQLSDEFRKFPCSREFYNEINAEYRNSDYVPSVSFSSYYIWYCESHRKHIQSGGTLKESTIVDLHKAMKVWEGLPKDEIVYWFCRNYNVHPRHRNLIAVEVEKTLNNTKG